MKSLYGRLFIYRERRHRRPLEDFLTEALCDLLNRLPAAEMAGFVSEFFLPPKAQEIWERQFGAATGLHWKTQAPINGLRADLMLLSVEEQPLIIVENKIGAGIGQHRTEDDEETENGNGDTDDGRTIDQLARYGRWLGDRCSARCWPGAIVLLTHFTAPPAGFGNGNTSYGVPWQRVCHWPAVWKWFAIQRSQANVDVLSTAWQVLAADLAQFLQEKGMTAETMTLHDLAAAEMYIASAERIFQLTERIWEEAVYPVWQQNNGRTNAYVSRGSIHHNSYGAVLQDWVYLQHP